MTLISITGTPGTGKTCLAEELRARGHDVLDLSAHIKDNGLLGKKDEKRDTFEVDVDSLDLSLEFYRGGEGTAFMEGHMSHCVGCDMIIVLRCRPNILFERLERRGYARSKIVENVQAEVLDIILFEASEQGVPVCEMDATNSTISELADEVEDILKGNTDKYAPGSIDWSGEFDRWF